MDIRTNIRALFHQVLDLFPAKPTPPAVNPTPPTMVKNRLDIPQDQAFLFEIHAKNLAITVKEQPEGAQSITIKAPDYVKFSEEAASEDKPFIFSLHDDPKLPAGIQEPPKVEILMPAGLNVDFMLSGATSLDSSVIHERVRLDIGDNVHVKKIEARNGTLIGNHHARVDDMVLRSGSFDSFLFDFSVAHVSGIAGNVHVETNGTSHFVSRITSPIQNAYYTANDSSTLEPPCAITTDNRTKSLLKRGPSCG